MSLFEAGRRRGNWLAAIVLPALVLRGLIPVGFMPGHSGLELCWGGITSSGVTLDGHPGPFHGDHRDGSGKPSQPSEHGAVCTFAASAAGLAPPSAHASVAPMWVSSELPGLRASAVLFTPTVLRAQSPRGPPSRS